MIKKTLIGEALLFSGKKHVATAVLLIAGLIPIKAEGTLLSIRDNRHLLGIRPNFR